MGQLLMVMWSGAVMVLLGVILGGFMVFRAKRPGEYVLPPKEIPVAGPIHVDGMFDAPPEFEDPPVDPLDITAMEQNAAFLRQVAKEKTDD